MGAKPLIALEQVDLTRNNLFLGSPRTGGYLPLALMITSNASAALWPDTAYVSLQELMCKCHRSGTGCLPESLKGSTKLENRPLSECPGKLPTTEPVSILFPNYISLVKWVFENPNFDVWITGKQTLSGRFYWIVSIPNETSEPC